MATEEKQTPEVRRFKPGDRVRKVIPDIVGEVVSGKLRQEDLELLYEVQYKDVSGTEHRRTFASHELEHDVNTEEGTEV